MEIDRIQKEFVYANVILNLPIPEQAGYSHRLINALVKGEKIITTNRKIARESFYDSEMIKIIDPGDYFIDHDWIKERLTPAKRVTREFPELSSWLESILNEEPV